MAQAAHKPTPAAPASNEPKPGPAAVPVKKKRTATAIPGETREQKLIRLANSRVGKALKYIRLVGNLAAYKPTDDQIAKIEEALGETSAAVVNRLHGSRKESFTFTLNQ